MRGSVAACWFLFGSCLDEGHQRRDNRALTFWEGLLAPPSFVRDRMSDWILRAGFKLSPKTNIHTCMHEECSFLSSYESSNNS